MMPFCVVLLAVSAPQRPPLGARLAAAVQPLLPAAAAHAASASFDFGYRLERSIDPEKRGPATNDMDALEPDGASALDAMCNPMPPPAATVAETALAAAESSAQAATASAIPSTAAAAAAAATSVAVVPADPASSAEPIFGAAGLTESVVGAPLVLQLLLAVSLLLLLSGPQLAPVGRRRE